MRVRLIFLVVAILLVAGFAALNWSEFERTAPLSFGLFVTEGSLAFVMLAILGLSLLGFLFSSAVLESRHLIESRQHLKTLEAQRDLADKAEASRFAELRQQFETHMNESREHRQHLGLASTEADKLMVDSQRELRLQLEQMGRAIAGRLSDLESRIDARLERIQSPAGRTVQPVSEIPVTELPLRDRADV